MKHFCSADEAKLVRAMAAEPGVVFAEAARAFRIFLPIEIVVATGRASCRLCGEKIERDESAVAFEFDHAAVEGVGAVGWGRCVRSYVHRECPREEISK